MEYKCYSNKYFLKLEQHEELMREVKKFCLEHNIIAAKISAIGAVNTVTLGYYNTTTQKYQELTLHTPFELTTATGTIFKEGDEEINIHMHGTIADKDYRVYGGHIFRAVTSKTIEILIENFE